MNRLLKIIPVIILAFLQTGCNRSVSSAIPDAPPPYPSYPVPQERYQGAEIYGGQPGFSSYVPPYSASNISSPAENPHPSYAYVPPYSPPPTNYASSPPHPLAPSTAIDGSRAKVNARFELEAKANLWALVQDSMGNELQWLKMQAGETASIDHPGALTLTCSSGDQLIVRDSLGKPLETNPNSSGISILRLPAR